MTLLVNENGWCGTPNLLFIRDLFPIGLTPWARKTTMNYRQKRSIAQNHLDLFDSTPSYGTDVEEFIQTWNSKIWLPKLLVTDRQCKQIREALRRPFFARHWRDSFAILARSSWLVFKKHPRFRIDWYLEPDNFDSIMEERYVDEKEEKPDEEKPHKTTRVGDDEFIT